MIQFLSDTNILNMRDDNIGTVRLATLQSQDWTTLQPSGLETLHTVRGSQGKPTRYTWRHGALQASDLATLHTVWHSAHAHTICTHMSRATWHWLLVFFCHCLSYVREIRRLLFVAHVFHTRSCKAVPSAWPHSTYNSLIICTCIYPKFFCA